jgi:dephospho-CoA kinase
MITIGLTGRIGSGKSEAARVLRDLGATVIDTARLGHDVYRSGSPAFNEIISDFGKAVAAPTGQIDRRRLGAVVFADPEKRRRLENIVWPAITEAIKEGLTEARSRGDVVAVLDSAMLLEAGWDRFTDEVWLVEAPEPQTIERVRQRSRLDEEQVRRRLAAQAPNTERRARAKISVWNDADVDALERRIGSAWESLMARASLKKG